MKISVLMSVYGADNPDYLCDALQSLADQTRPAEEVVLVEDGPLTPELDGAIDAFRKILNIVSVRLAENGGLARALNEGLKHCSHELVARMDADDISLPQRFARQAEFMKTHPELAVSSAFIQEFDEQMVTPLGIRSTPAHHDQIIRYARYRSPMNHIPSIFRLQVVLSVGGYPRVTLVEDHALWSRLIVGGFRLANLQEVLAHVRAGDSMLARRHGKKYFRQQIALLRYQREIGFLGSGAFFNNVIWRTARYMSPHILRKAAYQWVRRRQVAGD